MRFFHVIQTTVVLFLSCIAWVRTEFSIERISAPLDEKREEDPSEEVVHALNQPYHFLDRGRQAFVFESEDKKFVIKFFDKTYIQMPWYAGWFVNGEKEMQKRKLRQLFYWHGYRLAETFLKKQAALFLVHQGRIQGLPQIFLVDQTKRHFFVDLNRVPFVLQRKGEPFYDFLEKMYETEGKEGLMEVLGRFLRMIDERISLGISDPDYDVRRNFGVLDGVIVHLDPGRLSSEDLSNPVLRSQEWRRATRQLRKWLQKKYPDVTSDFDAALRDLTGE